MRGVWTPLLACLALLAIEEGRPAAAEDLPVDVELVMAVDISWSMNEDEQSIQRQGYVAAWRSKEVLDAVRDGLNGRVAVTYVEWAGDLTQNVVIPWTLIDSQESAERFATLLATAEPDRQRRTSISAAIDFSAKLFDGNGYAGDRRVIDISGDGANNQGRPVLEARDAAVAKGIVINGLPLMTQGGAEDINAWGSMPDLDRYYSQCVIGGPGAFMIPVTEWSQFPDAIRRKLVLELADRAPRKPREMARVVLTAGAPDKGSCLDGERQWRVPTDAGPAN
ncbi:DUF1194 domain-containing protein [Aureimonas sp. AU20]|uniref:DUF1194 domain-containing protein n=1 Tax=Aureimonas sp. AU20 TaxID=1349819 RepID=UPI000784878A|nr:DUF1194 domain-containing protein [Aureimonas sp. AU20]